MNTLQKDIEKRFCFRNIQQNETDESIQIEQICFPPHEACSPQSMRERVHVAAPFFLIAMDKENHKIAGFLNGIATNEKKFRDEFFTDASLHDTKGKNIMLLGLDVLPPYRRKGLATEIVFQYKNRARQDNREALILTCLDQKVSMYQKMGFMDCGIANSTWGNEQWHEMKCMLKNQSL